MLRLRMNSSLRAERTAFMSSFTSSRLMMSSTRAELIFTFTDWPFAFAGMKKKGNVSKMNHIQSTNTSVPVEI